MPQSSRLSAITARIDALIEKYGNEHPEIARDLIRLRSDLLVAAASDDKRKRSAAALRIALWIKFLMDQWPDG